MSTCIARTKDGTRCRNNAIAGTKTCYIGSHGGSSSFHLARALNWFVNNPAVAFISILGSIASIIGVVWYVRDQRINTRVGVVEAPSIAQRTYLSVGSARFIVDEPAGLFLRDGAEPLVRMNLTEGKLLLSARVSNASDGIVAELRDNEWAVNRNGVFDRNYTRNAVEVRDRDGNVALQVVSFGDTVHLAGILPCRDGRRVILAPIGSSGAMMTFVPPGAAIRPGVSPICEYPSETHLGVCPGIERLAAIVRHGAGPAYRLAGSLDVCPQTPADQGSN